MAESIGKPVDDFTPAYRKVPSMAAHLPPSAADGGNRKSLEQMVALYEEYVEESTTDLTGSSTTGGTRRAPTTGTERILAMVMADVSGLEQVSVDSHFFDDLGADSMMMARFCARVRKRGDLPPVSMKDVYQRPTISSLAEALIDVPPAAVEPSASPLAPTAVRNRAARVQYVVCGVLQLLFYVGYAYLAAIVLDWGFEWISGASGILHVYLRSVFFGVAVFFGTCALSVVAKWVLIGRWVRQNIPVWSLSYFRFWVVRVLVRLNPLALFVGSPLYVFYLRALGAKIGRNVVVFSRNVPVCTDLLNIGASTVIRKDSFFNCYRARSGLIETGAVTLGKDVVVGEGTVLDIDTALGDGAQLGHSSALHAGQAVPAGERWHGSPAQPTEVDYRTVEPARCGSLRRAVYAVLQLLGALLVFTPVAVGGVVMLLTEAPRLAVLLHPGHLALTSWTFYAEVLVGSFVVFFGAVLVGLLVTTAVTRVFGLAVKPGKVYRLYSIHYRVHRAIAAMTNIRFFMELFGDSSAIVHYLRSIGYRLSPVEQTGSNFGALVKQDTPLLTSVGTGTMVADGLSVINADYSSTSFRVSRVRIGSRNFLGNWVAYPAQGKTGDNCLLATKVMVPMDGQVRENVGLLGSPPFEIPRSVDRDLRFDHLRTGDEFRHRLAGKNRHNAATAAWFLFVRWFYFFGIVLLYALAVDVYTEFGTWTIALTNLLVLVFAVGYFVLVERASTGFRRLRPLYCSIYDIAFWRHERFWKSIVTTYLHAFDGTPWKNVIWRLLGVRIGRRVFDDGCNIPEKSLVAIGDDCMLNAGSRIWCHSQEDGTFKTDHTVIGAGCTLGVGVFVNYGVTMGDGGVLAADSFLMKGEEMPPNAAWGGNPAKETLEPLGRPAGPRGIDDDPDAVPVRGESGTR